MPRRLLLILRKLAWKPILKSLKERETGIADSLASAKKIKVEMAQMKNENEALLAKAREERAQLLKEARETKYWLQLLEGSQICNSGDVAPLVSELEELIKIFTAIIRKTAKH